MIPFFKASIVEQLQIILDGAGGIDVGEEEREFLRMFEAIYRELQKKGPMHEDMLELLIQQLFHQNF